MATDKSYLAFILDQLSLIDGITHRTMIGEYILYLHGKIAAYLCDNRLLVKILPSTEAMLPEARREPPYEGARNMLLVENVDDREFLKSLFEAMYPELPEPKKKAKPARGEGRQGYRKGHHVQDGPG